MRREGEAGGRAIVLYDDDCGFCRWSAERLRRWDRRGRLGFAPIQGGEGERLLGDLAPADRLSSWHVVTPDGRRWTAGAAAEPVFRALPGGGPLATLVKVAPRVTDRVYRWVAAHRGALGSLLGHDACDVHPGRASSAP